MGTRRPWRGARKNFVLREKNGMRKCVGIRSCFQIGSHIVKSVFFPLLCEPLIQQEVGQS